MSPTLELEGFTDSEPEVEEVKDKHPALSKITQIIEQANERETPANIYDATVNRKIPLTIAKGEHQFDVAIEIAPVSNDEWFELIEAVFAGVKRIKTVSVEMFAPYAKLGREKAIARFGYKENPNWREATRDSDFISALKAYLNVVADTESIATDDLLDDDADTPIKLKSEILSIDWETVIYFREETKAEMDEFLAALSNQPNKIILASHKKESAEHRIYALYEAMVTRTEGYKDEVVPAWHAVEATKTYLDSQLVRLGKL